MGQGRALVAGLCVLAAGCATTPPPPGPGQWLGATGEGHRLLIQSAAIAADVFNEVHDLPVGETSKPEFVHYLRERVTEARHLYRRAQSWNLFGMPAPPLPADRAPVEFTLAPALPVDVVYPQGGWECEIRTLRGKSVLAFNKFREPVWQAPFWPIVSGDRVDLDIADIIRHVKVQR